MTRGEAELRELAAARDALRSMLLQWHSARGAHATHDAPAIERAILALDVFLGGQARPLEFDDTVARLCEVARAHGWRLKSWGLQRIVPGDGQDEP